MEKKGPACTGKVTKAPTMGGVSLSKSPDGGAIEKSKHPSSSSRAEGQDKGSMDNNMSVKSSFGKVNTY
jgi:hypothetical protein